MAMISEVRIMCAQHDGLRELADAYRRELGKDGPDLGALASIRWKLMREVAVHIAFEDKHLYGALAQCGERIAELGRSMASELGHLHASLQDHVREWTSARIAEDWPGYRAAVGAFVTVLTTRMDREEQELYPLVLVAKAA